MKILLDQGGDLDFIWEETGGEKKETGGEKKETKGEKKETKGEKKETEGESQGKGKGKGRNEKAKDGLAMIHRAADSGNGEFESDMM